MYGERKTNWKCHVCKPRNKSQNNLYQSVVFDETSQQKKARNDDDEGNDNAKKFKESLSLSSLNSNLCSVESNVTELRGELQAGMMELKSQMEILVTNFNKQHMQMNDNNKETQLALSTITSTLSSLVTQVSDLNEKDKTREKQITTMDTRMNKFEQQLIVKNIEIKNIYNNDISAFEVVKKIANSRNVEINEFDVDRAYRLKRQNDKIIVEFSSLNKKIEFMSKIERHRVDSQIINSSGDRNSNAKYIYINDQLTFNYRRLLWITKTKAHEANWKYVWVRNGNIFARKAENSPAVSINNAADIECITSTI
ncbi:uncharacterized protein LOC119615182 [Lucilia sericata]|uniref:uncharacterized protein LOC119615182 n=1 Tax=Lucilia sericata TaxID=13632 RepID=UPI0018A87BA9|nr:uncharacterized protein LOC119615182 [Lucilia sericata]